MHIISMVMLMLCICSILPVGMAKQVPLYAANAKTGFDGWKIRTNTDNAYPNNVKRPPQPVVNNRVKVCANGSNYWTIYSPRIGLQNAKSVKLVLDLLIDASFTAPDIIVQAAQQDDQTFPRYGKFSEIDQFPFKKYEYEHVATEYVVRSASNLWFSLDVPRLYARPNARECFEIKSVAVSYQMCDSLIDKSQAKFPPAAAPPKNGKTTIQGTCDQNAEPVDPKKPPTASCDENGVMVVENACHCKAGFSLNKTKSCTICADRKFKEQAGNGLCINCGKNSESSKDGKSCLCLNGFSRHSQKELDSSADCKKGLQPASPASSATWYIVAISILSFLVVILFGLLVKRNCNANPPGGLHQDAVAGQGGGEQGDGEGRDDQRPLLDGVAPVRYDRVAQEHEIQVQA